jgi:hypothetical protein
VADLHRQLGDFLTELKRRKVFQVAAVYAAVARSGAPSLPAPGLPA